MKEKVSLYISRVQRSWDELWAGADRNETSDLAACKKKSNFPVKRYYKEIKQKVWSKPQHELFVECQNRLFERHIDGVWKLVQTKILLPWTRNGEQHIQHLEVPSRRGSRWEPPLVMLHGYGPPSGTFCRVINDLSTHFNIYALDWLGWGGSSKPKFWPKTREEAEDWYVESLEKWREAQGIKKMSLCGHSLGGYMATVYALKYPERVSRLVLLSPVGVPEKASRKRPSKKFKLNTGQFYRKIGIKLWTRGYTPHDLIKNSGPVGLGLTQKYIKRRFTWDSKNEKDEQFFRDYEPYFYNSFYGEGSGYSSLNLILLPGAWAYVPLVKRITTLKVPVDFIYGEHDWMVTDGAHKAVDLLKAKKDYYYEPTISYVPNCGHHLALTNPTGVVAEIFRIFGYPKKSRLNIFFWRTLD
jgi:pimeloyl-ACP methyl ester carboxylesterase